MKSSRPKRPVEGDESLLDRHIRFASAVTVAISITRRFRLKTNTHEIQITDELIKRRQDCLIFLHRVATYRSRFPIQSESAYIYLELPKIDLSSIDGLGNPTKKRIEKAMRNVRAVCPLEARAYLSQIKIFREARIRFFATETDERYAEYRYGKSSIAIMDRRVKQYHGQMTTRARYRLHKLLPRELENKRAEKQIKYVLNQLEIVRDEIFVKMGVPEQLRSMY